LFLSLPIIPIKVFVILSCCSIEVALIYYLHLGFFSILRSLMNHIITILLIISISILILCYPRWNKHFPYWNTLVVICFSFFFFFFLVTLLVSCGVPVNVSHDHQLGTTLLVNTPPPYFPLPIST